MNKSWKLSSFDTFCLGMNIKSAWLYKEMPDFEKMKSALEKIASAVDKRLRPAMVYPGSLAILDSASFD